MKNTVSCPAYLFYEQNEDGTRNYGGICGINPVYQTKGAACADIALPYSQVLEPGKAYKLDLWIGFEIPKGWKILMYPRSSLLVKYGLISPVSVIDQDYSGQHVHWPVFNVTPKPVVIYKGDRIAQIECVPYYDNEDWGHRNEERGQGGFGSTGVK